MSKTEQLNNLFAKWREEYKGKEFAEDGIIDEECWNKAVKRILLVMKESNDYASDLRALGNKDPWRVEGYWSYGLQNTDRQTIPSFPLAYDDLNWKTAFRSSAVTNLKKAPGGSVAQMDIIKNVAQTESEFILKEIDIIRPDIIVCCATFNICREIMPSDVFTSIGPDGLCYTHKDIIWIDYCHPGAHYRHDMMYYTLMVLYQNCLREISSGE